MLDVRYEVQKHSHILSFPPSVGGKTECRSRKRTIRAYARIFDFQRQPSRSRGRTASPINAISGAPTKCSERSEAQQWRKSANEREKTARENERARKNVIRALSFFPCARSLALGIWNFAVFHRINEKWYFCINLTVKCIACVVSFGALWLCETRGVDEPARAAEAAAAHEIKRQQREK